MCSSKIDVIVTWLTGLMSFASFHFTVMSSHLDYLAAVGCWLLCPGFIHRPVGAIASEVSTMTDLLALSITAEFKSMLTPTGHELLSKPSVLVHTNF
jgi:hypothetical protein